MLSKTYRRHELLLRRDGNSNSPSTSPRTEDFIPTCSKHSPRGGGRSFNIGMAERPTVLAVQEDVNGESGETDPVLDSGWCDILVASEVESVNDKVAARDEVTYPGDVIEAQHADLRSIQWEFLQPELRSGKPSLSTYTTRFLRHRRLHLLLRDAFGRRTDLEILHRPSTGHTREVLLPDNIER